MTANVRPCLVAGLLGDGEPADVVVGIETDRGPWVQALIAAGYQVYAINPLSVARYRERHVTSGAKSDAGDAKVLADLVRTDRHQHRPIAGDSDAAEAVKVLARAHQNLIWSRQRQANTLRSTLREFYPAALAAFDQLTDRDASPCWTSPRPPPADRPCHWRRSPRHCGGPDDSATSTPGPNKTQTAAPNRDPRRRAEDVARLTSENHGC